MAEVSKKSRRPPARTPEDRINRLINLALDVIEQRLIAGTATSQETTFIAKLGSERERLEQEKLRSENKLLNAKADAIEAEKDSAEKYEQAIAALRKYSGEDGYYDEDV